MKTGRIAHGHNESREMVPSNARPGARVLFALAIVLASALSACSWMGGKSARPGDGGSNPMPSGVLPDSAEESEARRRARIRLELAAGYYQKGNYNVALDELRQSLAIDPDYPAAFGMLGLVYMDLNDRPRADESFQRAMRLAPNDSDISNNYGWYLCQTGREQASFDYFMRALRNPLYATPSRPLHNAGLCALRMNDPKAAEGYFLRAFQIDAANPVAMFNLAEINLRRGDLARARFYVERLTGAFDPSAEILWLALRLERKSGNADAQESFAAQLRRRFAGSREAGLLASGQFGD